MTRDGGWIGAGAVLGGLGVAAGAFGAHALRGLVETKRFAPRMFEIFEVAVRYQMYHALALLAVGLLVLVSGRSRATTLAGFSFLIGTIVFSGSLYALAFSGVGVLGAITPLGGLAFLVGWGALAVAGRGAVSAKG